MAKAVVLPLQQLREDQDLCSFSVDLNARTAYETPAAMKTPQDSVNPSAEVACETELARRATDNTELWHRQMGHISPKSLDILKNAEGNGVG